MYEKTLFWVRNFLRGRSEIAGRRLDNVQEKKVVDDPICGIERKNFKYTGGYFHSAV